MKTLLHVAHMHLPARVLQGCSQDFSKGGGGHTVSK